jgi:predicted RNA-binding Zn-ribbon protein involved in translation (DUF1610 family)
MSDILTPKIVKYKCTKCGAEETRKYPHHTIPEITYICPECNFLTMKQVKYDYFKDGPKS